MKKILYSLAVMAFVFTSCAKSDATLVQEVGEKFLTAITSGDLATAQSLVTPATSEKWGETADFLDLVLFPEAKAALQSATTKVSDVKVEGETAEATIAIAIPALAGEITVLHFQKVGENWLINEPGVLVKEVFIEETVVVDADSTAKTAVVK